MNPIPASKWEWYGNSAHFIGGQWCRFHMATKIGKYLISTVGEYIHPRHAGGSELKETEWRRDNWPGEDIGCGRKFETMVFEVNGKTCECGCGLPNIIPNELDCWGYNTHIDARLGHMMLCNKWSKKR